MQSKMIGPKIKERFPNLDVRCKTVGELLIERSSSALDEFKSEVTEQIRGVYDLKTLKDDPYFRNYRDFFWKIGIDPTKIRPSSEALIRRILQGKKLPQINTAVDSYNLASIKSRVPLAAFDSARLKGELSMRFSAHGEEFLGIAMKEPKMLKGKEIVVEDREKLVAIYPYRDSDKSKVTLNTTEILLMSCGVPGVDAQKLEATIILAEQYLVEYCKA